MPRKIGNTYRILVKIALFDAEFIEGFIKRESVRVLRKQSLNKMTLQLQLLEKFQYSKRLSDNE